MAKSKKKKACTLKTFKVWVWEEHGGYCRIKAASEEEARQIVEDLIDEGEELPDLDVTYGERHVVDVAEEE